MQQAAQVALIQRERDQDCVGETGSGSDKEDLQDFEFKDELFEWIWETINNIEA